MTKYKAFLRLLDKPYKTIKWFTLNWDKEIGAFGIGEMKHGELVIEKLVFPKQKVTGTHVHFEPGDWAPIVQELTDEEFSKIVFYWHKHPDNMPGASLGDEDDTFDVIMPVDTDRPHFAFMQTSKTHSGSMEYEARIEMRRPLFASITDVKLVTNDDTKMEKACRKIIKTHVTEGYGGANNQPGMGGGKDDHKKDTTAPTKREKVINLTDDDDVYDEQLQTSIFEVKKYHGKILIRISNFFEPWVEQMLDGKGICDKFSNMETDNKDDDTVEKLIYPKKKQFKTIFKFFKSVENELWSTKTEINLEESVKDAKIPTKADNDKQQKELWNKYIREG